MGLAYTYYVCVYYGDASVHMPSLILAGYLVQSRGASVLAIGQSLESRGEFRVIFFCCGALQDICFVGMTRFMFCKWEFGSLRGGSIGPPSFMQSSSVACSSGCHKYQRKCWIVVGGEESSLNLSCASCRFCVIYKGEIHV